MSIASAEILPSTSPIDARVLPAPTGIVSTSRLSTADVAYASAIALTSDAAYSLSVLEAEPLATDNGT